MGPAAVPMLISLRSFDLPLVGGVKGRFSNFLKFLLSGIYLVVHRRIDCNSPFQKQSNLVLARSYDGDPATFWLPSRSPVLCVCTCHGVHQIPGDTFIATSIFALAFGAGILTLLATPWVRVPVVFLAGMFPDVYKQAQPGDVTNYMFF